MKESNFQFKDPYLTKVDFEFNKDFIGGKEISIENNMSVDIKRKEDEPIAVVSVKLVIGEKSEKMPFFIDCAMESSFKWNESEYDEKTVNELLSINAPSLLLGYLRPIVSQITNLSPYPPYNIPFYNFLNNEE